MIITFICVGILIAGLICLSVSKKWYSEILEGTGIISTIMGAVSTVVVLMVIGIAHIPGVAAYNDIKFQENYNTIIMTIQSDNTKVYTLSTEIANYNSSVRIYKLRINDPCLNWFTPRLENEPKLINIEDYL